MRQARHTIWLSKKRSSLAPNRQLLPAAAALTVAGVLIGGAGTALQLNPPGEMGPDPASITDPANYASGDRDVLADRASRGDTRIGSVPTDAPTTPPTRAAPPPTQPAGSGAVAYSGTCDASYYDEPQHTANGEVFNPDAFTAAHKNLPFNSRVRVTNVSNGKSVVVRINDRGPFISGRCLDLSAASFAAIANLNTGVIDVRYEVLVQDAT